MTSSFENLWLGLRYFFLFPIFSLLPPPLPRLFSRFLARMEYRYHRVRRESIRAEMVRFPQVVPSLPATLDSTVCRYFEMIFCDEMDLFVYLLGFSRNVMKTMKIEGEDHLQEGVKNNRGGILLSAHFGAGFWILPLLKDRGISAHFFSADIDRSDHPSGKALYYYRRLRIGAVKRATGERTLYKKAGRQELIQALNSGKWVIILFDVPPFLVKDVMETPFLGRRAIFPKGIVSIARETQTPILPFFAYLDGEKERRLVFEKPFFVDEVDESVRTCVRLIEKNVIERPDHWHLWPVAHHFFIDPEQEEKSPISLDPIPPQR